METRTVLGVQGSVGNGAIVKPMENTIIFGLWGLAGNGGGLLKTITCVLIGDTATTMGIHSRTPNLA